VAKLDCVLVEIKFDSETECILVPARASLDIVLVVTDIFPCSSPTPEFLHIFEQVFILVLRLPFVNILVQPLFGVDIAVFPCGNLE